MGVHVKKKWNAFYWFGTADFSKKRKKNQTMDKIDSHFKFLNPSWSIDAILPMVVSILFDLPERTFVSFIVFSKVTTYVPHMREKRKQSIVQRLNDNFVKVRWWTFLTNGPKPHWLSLKYYFNTISGTFLTLFKLTYLIHASNSKICKKL